MIWGSVSAMQTTDFLQLGKHVILKSPAHVMVDSCWKSKVQSKVIEDLIHIYYRTYSRTGILGPNSVPPLWMVVCF